MWWLLLTLNLLYTVNMLSQSQPKEPPIACFQHVHLYTRFTSFSIRLMDVLHSLLTWMMRPVITTWWAWIVKGRSQLIVSFVYMDLVFLPSLWKQMLILLLFFQFCDFAFVFLKLKTEFAPICQKNLTVSIWMWNDNFAHTNDIDMPPCAERASPHAQPPSS
jgi:hypothetical protein